MAGEIPRLMFHLSALERQGDPQVAQYCFHRALSAMASLGWNSQAKEILLKMRASPNVPLTVRIRDFLEVFKVLRVFGPWRFCYIVFVALFLQIFSVMVL